MSTASSQDQKPWPLPPDYTQEVRFAVVMYGGVSLAIYINGIAQELLRLVRSTSPGYLAANDPNNLTSTERMYRKLSFLLANQGKDPAAAMADADNPDLPPPTRFVIDILSGTSAGGINGIFLAKALANGQDLEKLKDLWIREGDITTLINDKFSQEVPLVLQDPPPSLLNGRRLYLELLKAFDSMDENPGNESRSAYVDEVDLYVTSTDLQGVVLPIQLSDALVYERRHRNVLHFIYSKKEVSGADNDRNDFVDEYNPFLAYTARCTSSFPFAFEPMLLTDIDDVLAGLPNYRGKDHCGSASKKWLPFFKSYQDPRNLSTVPFPERSFGDGGYLDNKPFSYAIDALTTRQADVPVIRKLIYVEPSPEHPEDEQESSQRPDFLTNVKAALLTLPQYETIREDLRRVLDRNHLVDRINRVVKGVDHDVETADAEAACEIQGSAEDTNAAPPTDADLRDKPPPADEEWARFDLADMVKLKGRAYLAYHRLEIAAVTDAIAQLVSRVAGLDEESDSFLVVRSLLRAWRMRAYVEYHHEGADRPTMNDYLWSFNLAYPMRRINFLRAKIDQLYRLDGSARDTLNLRCRGFWSSAEELPVNSDSFKLELKKIKGELNRVHRNLRYIGRTLRSRTVKEAGAANSGMAPSPLFSEIQSLMAAIREAAKELVPQDKDNAVLQFFLARRKNECEASKRIEEICDERADELLTRFPAVAILIDKTARSLKTVLSENRATAEDACRRLFNEGSLPDDPLDAAVSAARQCLKYYYEHYDDYDMITFPLLYETGVGEAEIVDVTRVSPEDARTLIDERGVGCHKLAGTALAHFGAFLDSTWRKNDIFWGRLDGAERIIKSLLPYDAELAAELIGNAQAAIVCETLRPRGKPLGPRERNELLAESLMRTKSGKAEPELLTNFISTLKNNTSDPDLRRLLDDLIDEAVLRQRYLDIFDERSRLAPEETLRSAARATTVVGLMLAAVSADNEAASKYVAWIARLGQIFWSLVEVAVPRSIPNLVFHHWIKLLYLFEVLLIVGTTLLGEEKTQLFALTAFGISVAVHCAVAILGDLMKRKNHWLTLIKALIATTLVALIVLGLVSAAGILGVDRIWDPLYAIHGWAVTPGTPRISVRIGVSAAFILFLLVAVRGDLKNAVVYQIKKVKARWKGSAESSSKQGKDELTRKESAL
jgi:patatin-related protein